MSAPQAKLHIAASNDASAGLPDTFDPASCFSSLARLPGVVLYQRLVTTDGQIRYTYISEGAKDLFGVDAHEIITNPDALLKTHSSDYKAKFRERLMNASRSLSVWDVEASLVTEDGRKKYTHAIARPERREDGSTLWTGVILDETRTREAVIENLSQGVMLYDSEGRLLLRNSQYIKMFPTLADIAVPGASYKDVLLNELAFISGIPANHLEHTPGFRARMDQHALPKSVFEQELPDNRWVLIDEHRTSDGGAVVTYTDITALKQREGEIRHLAYHDALTGLPNRTLFQQRIDAALAACQTRGTHVAIMCLDLDFFKNVNDLLGHSGGDELLKIVAARLKECLRERDTVARLGGDEFGIVLADLPRADVATMMAWRVLDAISKPVDYNGQHIVSGISLGIATSMSGPCDASELLKRADLALYRAKADGRGTFRFFESEMDALAQARRALEIDLRQAVAKEQLELFYQPQVSVETNEVVAFEALVRWRHPQRGLISPGEFIPLAEETGIITRLGEWVLRQACMDALAWPARMKVSVNVSPAQFKNRDLPQVVSRILQETGLNPTRLEIEVTESLLLRDVATNLEMLRALKALGIRIAMDDFGTGYSSLGNLRSFPFDKIKIDRSFVSDLESSPDAAAIVHAVLGLGHSLGMATCAEGVETREQLAYLRGEGCTEVQGYFYSKPKPVSEITEIIKTGFRQDTGLSLADYDKLPGSGKLSIVPSA